jgi:MoaA/NifB/PqqE/SkfB family radical SAM enzyme
MAVIRELALAGVSRVNFSGGEPTLHAELFEMLIIARSLGLATSIITNGWGLTDEVIACCDLVGLSIDSATNEGNARVGRTGRGGYVEETLDAAFRIRRSARRLKVNTVVTSMNVHEDLKSLYRQLRPDKLKILQFTPVLGENAGRANSLRVSEDAFDAFVRRHRSVADDRTVGWLQVEGSDVIAKSYVMIDPLGRVFQHAPCGGHAVSRPVLEVGFEEALHSVGGYDRGAFEERGGDVRLKEVAA